MKKLFCFVAMATLALMFASCNKYCVCTVSKDGETLEERDYSDEGLTTDECMQKVDDTWEYLGSTYTSESLTGVTVSCSHL